MYVKSINNHFDDRSKIKLPKIRHFCNLKKNAIIARKCRKMFSASVLEGTVCANIIKIIPNERGDQMHVLHIIILFFKNATPFKINPE